MTAIGLYCTETQHLAEDGPVPAEAMVYFRLTDRRPSFGDGIPAPFEVVLRFHDPAMAGVFRPGQNYSLALEDIAP